MAFTSGFFNSSKGDRKYNAEQVSEIFDGILADGIIPTQGQLFAVLTAENGMQITVGTGRAWFDHTWSKNDSVMVLTVEDSDVSRGRYDTVVLEVNRSKEVRANSIKIIKGIASQNPEHPNLLNTTEVKQYPLAYIFVGAGVEEIKASNIENMVGRAPTVFATGILETAPLDELWAQWKGEWEEWFASIKLQLSGDIVTNLQYQIDQLKELTKGLEGIHVETVVHTDIITSTTSWQNTVGKNLKVNVRVFGGGAGATSTNDGGGSGHMATWSGTIPKDEKITVTIGAGGNSGANGGTTSFGSYISANGGNGINGGAGGGGHPGTGYGSTGGGIGGTGSYGGGGGGGCHVINTGRDKYDYFDYSSGRGGNGGTYGGGGGAGGNDLRTSTTDAQFNLVSVSKDSVSGGSGGTHGGAGGGTGAVSMSGYVSSNVVYSASDGVSAVRGTNTQNMDLDFTGPGNAGSNGGSKAGLYRPSGSNKGYLWIAASAGGAGGGGYGGNGGAGLLQVFDSGNYSGITVSSGGGGGGGYGGNGGTGCVVSSTSGNSGGGGGGGYGGNGGNGGYSGQGYGAGGSSSTAGGGGGYGKTPANTAYSTNQGKGINGVCIITYVTKEIVFD